MSWHVETEEHNWLEEWYELKPKFRVKCREVSCGREEILYVSIDNFKKHMEDAHQKIASYEKKKSEIRCPSSNNWKYFMLWKELQMQSPFLKDLQSASKMVQYSIMCILCYDIIPYNNESAIENHIKEKHFDIENEYRERNFPDFWPWKYQIKLGLDFFVKCYHCGKCVTLELSTKSLKKHYEENHKEIWKNNFKQEEAYDQAGPSIQPLEDRTLESEFKEHRWLKTCYKYQRNSNFHLKCRICKTRLLYVNIKNFADHMKINHIKIFELEDKKLDFIWIYFIHREEEKIECLICQKIVTNESTQKHALNHIFNDPYFNNYKYRFLNINYHSKNWVWKYQRPVGDYIVKCILCKASPRIHLVPATANLERHKDIHKDEEERNSIHIWEEKKMQKQADHRVNGKKHYDSKFENGNDGSGIFK